MQEHELGSNSVVCLNVGHDGGQIVFSMYYVYKKKKPRLIFPNDLIIIKY